MLAFCLAFCLQILSLLCCCIFCSVPGSFIVHVLAQQTLHWILIAILNTRGSPPNFHRFWQMALRVLYSAPGGGGGWHFRSAISHRSCFRHRRIIFRGTSAAVGEVAGATARLSHFVFPTGKIPNTSMTPRKARILNAPRNLNPQEGLRESGNASNESPKNHDMSMTQRRQEPSCSFSNAVLMSASFMRSVTKSSRGISPAIHWSTSLGTLHVTRVLNVWYRQCTGRRWRTRRHASLQISVSR